MSEKSGVAVLDIIETGARIKYFMDMRKVKVKDVQKVIGFSNPNAIYKWRQGRAMPTIDNLIILASILDVKLDDLVVTTKMEDRCF